MNPEALEPYVDKVYAYAIKRTFTEEEAADLSQEILFTAIRELPKLRDENKLAPWLWGIADNVSKTFRRKQGKQRAMFSYDFPEGLIQEEEPPEKEEELYAALRAKIAGLSQMYRDIIILHYYDGLSTKQISERLSIPEGTVTWRLSEARKKLKKECTTMEESALRPKLLGIGITGSGDYSVAPFPHVYINDALSQNILYYCYEEGHTVEDLSKLCGVPAYYIEERIENLIKREALLEPVKGKYRTDFVIWSDKYGIYCEEHAEKSLLPIMDKLLDALDNIASEANQLNFYKAGKSEKDLYYLYGVLAFYDFLNARYDSFNLPYPKMKECYDGNNWRYIGFMETGKHRTIRVNWQINSNMDNPGGYRHLVFGNFAGYGNGQMMLASQINACDDILTTGSSSDTKAVTDAIQAGKILRKDNGEFSVTLPAFDIAAKEAFYQIVEKHMAPLAEEYFCHVKKFVAGYKKLFPKHLSDDADRACHTMACYMFSAVMDYALRIGKIEPPTEGTSCEILMKK